MIFPPRCPPASVSQQRGIPTLVSAKAKPSGRKPAQRGKDIMLGPGVNILRTPLCGRNFEYLGEDPFLTSRMAVGYIRGEQSQDISSCVKHFALNNQEFERGSINVEVDERALHEIYLPAFKAAVQEGRRVVGHGRLQPVSRPALLRK
jgi:beta-glucosidase